MSEQYPSRVAEKIVVRLPDGMRDRLAEMAKENKRSVNAEVVDALEHWIEIVNFDQGRLDTLDAMASGKSEGSARDIDVLFGRLTAIAKANGRSVNAEILARLTESFETNRSGLDEARLDKIVDRLLLRLGHAGTQRQSDASE